MGGSAADLPPLVSEGLITENDIQTDPSSIMSYIKNFYSSLYTRRTSKSVKDCLEYLKNISIPKPTENERDSCEGILTKKECWDALQSMKNNKSPGNDELTKEFYVCLFKEISSDLVDTPNHSFKIGQMSASQRQVLITSIEKKDKDKRYIKNWRPMSLINVDAKVASKVLSSRMRNVLASIANCDQTTYEKGRYIGESIRLINDILEYTEENNFEGLLFSVDFEKAFDSIEHPFILSTLESFGFGSQFIKWIETFLNGAESCVMNNGHTSGYFLWKEDAGKVTHFLHISIYYLRRVFFIQIRKNNDIHGIKIGDHEVKF